MIINSSQSIQTRNPLDTTSAKRVNGDSRAPNLNPEDKQAQKEAQKAQQQQNDAMLRQLRARDREVRAHEAAHVAAGGSLVRGGPSFSMQNGPDGRAYAIGGEVQIDVSPVADDPDATLVKSGRIRAAALAPANPSPQDRSVAANANQLASRARVDIAIQRREEAQVEDKQQTLNDASDNSDASSEAATVNDLSPTEPSVVSSSLQSEKPVAAMSAFMATAETQSTPVLLSQFA